MGDSEKKYHQVYNYYKNLIRSGDFPPGKRLPSIRQRAEELGVSRTTVEMAYMMLAADGYIISKPQSGFYVTDLFSPGSTRAAGEIKKAADGAHIRYDFASAGADPEMFRFEVWRRYMRNALRQDERLLSYGDPQGEPDLREELASYLAKNRSVIGRADNIVVGAGTQSLLQILCPMIRTRGDVYFRGAVFPQGRRIFEDFGIGFGAETPDPGQGPAADSIPGGPEHGGIYYITPSRMTGWGSVMPVRERADLLRSAGKRGALIIEDDYGSELYYTRRPVPSVQGLAKGRNVVYMGTFSMLLLPSIRLSFMILPDELLRLYRETGRLYNQTASKAEQIALCQYIRDGNLESQIRKTRKSCVLKQNALLSAVREVFGDRAKPVRAESGFVIAVDLLTGLDAGIIRERASRAGVAVRVAGAAEKMPGRARILLSFASMGSEHFRDGLYALRSVIGEQ